ncbi:MAG: VPLPA-CTERM sorting domain-containing protein [Parvularculaceae bacterium]
MKSLRYLAAAALAAGFIASPANATLFVFKSGGVQPHDVPLGNIVKNCGTINTDYCTADPDLGFTYSKAGITVNAVALSDGEPTTLIQDIFPDNSGLGAFSDGETDAQDQVETNSDEALEFVFNTAVWLSNIEFNSGADRDCSAASQPEGVCGSFNLYIDDVFYASIAAVDLLTDTFYGTKFLFEAATEDAGFVIAQFEVSDVPVPAALPLLLSGLAGLGFASRRRKTA